MSSEVFIIGDSNAVALASAASALGIAWHGGPVGTGKALESKFWDVDDGAFKITLPVPDKVRRRFDVLLQFDGPILSVVGFNAHRFASDFAEYLNKARLALRPQSLSEAVFRQCVIEARANVLDFYRLLVQADRTVYFTHSPNRYPTPHQALVHGFEEVLIAELLAIGVRFIDVREICLDEGRLRPEFCQPTDAVHANQAYGQVVIEKLLEVYETA